MAEINSGESHKKQIVGVSKAKKRATRVDLTPMVDLGFLLITFFIFTTTISQPTAMKLILPNDKGSATPIKEGGALTILPAANRKVYYYEGEFNDVNIKATTVKEIRDVIIDKKRRTPQNNLFIVIKPSKSSAFGNIVDVLDEMTINDVKRFALVDITDKEESRLK